MKSKKYLIYLIVMVGLFLVGCSSDSTDIGNAENEETITLTVASNLPVTHTLSVHGEVAFMERVTELTEGRVQFEHYPAEQMGSAADTLDLTAEGVMDIGWTNPVYTASQMPYSSSLVSLPGLFESAVEGSKVYYEVNRKEPMLETDYLSNGVRPLVTILSPPFGIFTDEIQVKSPEDLEGMDIRVPGGVMNNLASHIGYNPVSVTVADLFSSLDRGVVNGIQSYFVDVKTFGVSDLVSYGTENLAMGSLAAGFIMNEEVYQGLPEDIQEALMQASEEISVSAAEAWDAENAEIMKELESNGLTIHDIASEPEAAAKWEDLFNEFNESWLNEQDEEHKKVFEMIQEELES